MYSTALLFSLLLFRPQIAAKVYERCELASALRDVYHFPSQQLAQWVCTANFESHFNTSAINAKSGDHGLFQINQKWWCSPSESPGKACNAVCSQFRDDDIRDDVRCVRKIYREHQRISGNGFNAWVAYKKHCTGDVSKYIKDCFN